MEAHHGRIDVQSEENKGSSFRVTLPVRQEKTEPLEVAGETSEVPEDILLAQPANLTNKKQPVILIAEDNEDMARFLADSFGTAYMVITAADGTEALQRLKEQEVSLIISDWMMPNMDGIELCRRVREDRLTSHIPFILLTAKTDNASKTAGMNCGADAYIEKPFSMQYLEACVKNLMDLRSQLQQKFAGSAHQHDSGQPGGRGVPGADEPTDRKQFRQPRFVGRFPGREVGHQPFGVVCENKSAGKRYTQRDDSTGAPEEGGVAAARKQIPHQRSG